MRSLPFLKNRFKKFMKMFFFLVTTLACNVSLLTTCNLLNKTQ